MIRILRLSGSCNVMHPHADCGACLSAIGGNRVEHDRTLSARFHQNISRFAGEISLRIVRCIAHMFYHRPGMFATPHTQAVPRRLTSAFPGPHFDGGQGPIASAERAGHRGFPPQQSDSSGRAAPRRLCPGFGWERSCGVGQHRRATDWCMLGDATE